MKFSRCIRKAILDIPSYRLSTPPLGVQILAKLNSNESPLAPSRAVLEAITEATPIVNRYPIASQELRQKIAGYVSLKPENVLIGNGSDELIDAVVKTFVNPGEKVIVSVPTFEMYEFYTKLAGGQVQFVRMRRDFSYNVKAILKAISRRTKLVFICSPNNPTGSGISEEDVSTIAEKDVIVVVDEAYVEFARKSLVPLLKEQNNLVFLRTFSKAFGLAGLRIGYALATADVMGYMQRVRPPFPVNILALRAAEVAIEDRERLKQVKELVSTGRQYLCSELSEIEGVNVYPSEANFLLVNVAKTGFTSTELVERLVQRGVIVRDCIRFRGLGQKYIRVTVGTREENGLFIQVLKNVLAGGR